MTQLGKHHREPAALRRWLELVLSAAPRAERPGERDQAPSPPRRTRYAILLGLALLLIAIELTVGLRVEHLVAVVAIAGFVCIGGRAYRFVVLFLPVPLVGISYDFSRLLAVSNPNVHVADLYYAELLWFGVGSGAARQTLPEYFATRTWASLDLACGFAYLIYLYVPMVLAVVLFFLDRRRMAWIVWAFLVVNLMGIATYLLYPAAPPWYVAKYGLGPAQLDALPDGAGALRFDALLGIDYFKGFYARSSHVFGAMPSLHVGYTMVAFLGVLGMGRRWDVPLGAFTLLVSFAAVYLQHHYLLDVIAGVAYGIAAHALVRVALRRLSRAPLGDEASGGHT